MIPRPTNDCYVPIGDLPMGEDRFRMLSEENARLRAAGAQMAIAALRVSTEYDGVHRLLLAVSVWAKAMADEHGRGEKAGEQSDGRD